MRLRSPASVIPTDEIVKAHGGELTLKTKEVVATDFVNERSSQLMMSKIKETRIRIAMPLEVHRLNHDQRSQI